MKNALITLLFIFTIFNISAQNQVDTIVVKKKMGVVFMQNGRYLKPIQLLEITKSNTNAFKEMKIAKTNFDVGTVFGAIGGALVGYPIGTYLGGGEPVWELAAIGVGFIAISIPFSVAYSSHAKNAVRIYNSDLKNTTQNIIQFKIGITNNGLALKMKF